MKATRVTRRWRMGAARPPVVQRAVSASAEREVVLDESALRYRMLADNAADVMFQLGPDESTIEWAAPSVTEILGWRPEQMVGSAFSDYLTAESEELVRRARAAHPDDVARVDQLQHRCADGSYLWMSARSRRLLDGEGRVIGRVVALRDIDDRVAARRALAASEARYRLLAENASDIVFQSDRAGVLMWVSPSVERLLGVPADRLIGTPVLDLVVEDDRSAMRDERERVFAGTEVEALEVRFEVAGGDRRWMSLRCRPLIGADGAVSAAVVGVRDCHAEVLARRAAATLSAGSGIVATATDEDQLLVDMCQTAVDKGGYLFAWYGRAVADAQCSVAKVAFSRERRTYLDEITVTWDDGPHGQGPTGIALRTATTRIVHDFASDASYRPWLAPAAAHGFRSSITLPVLVDGVLDGAFMVYAGEPLAFDDHAVALLEDLAAQVGAGLRRLRDNRKLIEALQLRDLLTTAIDQADEAIIVTDTTPVIRYANPSALRSGGWTLAEVIGRPPMILQSGLHDGDFYAAVRQQLAEGVTWTGVVANRRKNGDVYEEDVTIAPVRGDDGAVIAFVSVKRDLTRERSLEADLSRERGHRDELTQLMHRVRPAATLEATAERLAEACRELDGIDAAAMLLVRPDRRVAPVGVPSHIRRGSDPTRHLTLDDFGPLAANTETGPWFLDLTDAELHRASSFDPVVIDNMVRVGYTALAFVPVRRDRQLVGFLSLATKAPSGPALLRAKTGMLTELAVFAGTVVGAQAEQYARREALRLELRDVITGRTFEPVYQPVIDLRSGHVRGYEALTRFHDGRRPDLRFTDAHTVALGCELEAACAVLAIDDARRLPDDVWLSVNFSPAAIIGGHAAAAVAAAGRPVVIEITEHVPIESYPLVRRALAGCRDVRVSVDDAGAGYASLQHILELKPDMVKLDIAIVSDIDKDPARQALVAGLIHFAGRTHTEIIAEGVETQAEAHTLIDLGVHLAQGILFGRPRPLPITLH